MLSANNLSVLFGEFLRSTMSQLRLKSMTIHIHKDLADKLDLLEIGNKLVAVSIAVILCDTITLYIAYRVSTLIDNTRYYVCVGTVQVQCCTSALRGERGLKNSARAGYYTIEPPTICFERLCKVNVNGVLHCFDTVEHLQHLLQCSW